MSETRLEFGKVLGWWSRIRHSPAARAGLRRSRDLEELLLDRAGAEAFVRLTRTLGQESALPRKLGRAALAIAEINEDVTASAENGGRSRGAFGRRCAAGSPAGGALLSPNRFRLLMGAEEEAEFLRLLRSALGQIERQAPIADVFWLAHGWDSPERRRAMRRDQLLAYYEVVPKSALKET